MPLMWLFVPGKLCHSVTVYFLLFANLLNTNNTKIHHRESHSARGQETQERQLQARPKNTVASPWEINKNT